MARTKATHELIATAANNKAVGTPLRYVFDTRGFDAGIITMKITNDGTLGAQCVCKVMMAHNVTASPPSAGAAGATWKTLFQFGGGTTSGAVTEQSFNFGPEYGYLEIEFDGNTTTTCSVEAYATTVNYEA